MKLDKDKYIIVEIIPNHSNYQKGCICQIQALKLNGLKLIDRFDYRLTDNLVNNITVLNTMKYDCDMFKYVFDTDTMMNDFKTFVGDYTIFIVEDSYTLDYLSYLDNKMELIYPYLNMEYSLDVFDKIIDKYNLEPSNHLVDLIYEAIIYESNNET